MKVFLLTLLAVLLLAAPARAHGSRTATVTIVATSATEATLALRGPSSLRVEAPGCAVLEGRALRCPRGLAGQELAIASRDVDVVLASVTDVRGEARGFVLASSSPRFTFPSEGDGAFGIVARYTQSGVAHVLSGLDHVLFLVALFWQALAAARGDARRAARELAATATAFTLAHSVTLAATALGVLRVPGAIAEAAIALTLVAAALDVARDAPAPARRRLGLAAAFGLVHGLGFAGALAESGLPRGAAALGLFSFNVGVEVGQVLLLAACSFAVAALRVLRTSRVPALASAYAVGGIGCFLFLGRMGSLLHL